VTSHSASPLERAWDEDWIRGLPKAEVHCHLEGCIERDLVRRAAKRKGVAVPFEGAEETMASVGSLAELLSYLDFSCALIDEPDDLAAIAYCAARHATASGTRYLDVILTPLHWQAWLGRTDAMVDALDGGFRQAESDGLAPSGLCLSVNRGQPAAAARELVEWMADARHPRVVALSIDGNEEHGSNNERFAEAFSLAASSGFHRCAHAGESSGPIGVREAVEVLGAERIDHGIRAVEDPQLVSDLARWQVPLDICPTSNRILGLTPEPALHPVDRLRSAGVRVSLNTDDPLIYGCDLAGEYAATARTFGWGRDELLSVARTSIASSFAEEGRRQDLMRALDAYARDSANGTGNAGTSTGAPRERGFGCNDPTVSAD
jgi:adenosine deaminase